MQVSHLIIDVNALVEYIAARLVRGRRRAAVVHKRGVVGRSPGVLVGDLEGTERCSSLVVVGIVSPTHVPPEINIIQHAGQKLHGIMHI